MPVPVPVPDHEDAVLTIQRELDDLKHRQRSVAVQLHRIDARMAELRQQLKDFNEEEWK